MACAIAVLRGIGVDCESNLAGIKRVLLTDYRNIDGAPTVTEDASTGEEKITAINLVDGAAFVEYVFAKNTGSLTKTLTKDETTGVKYYTCEVTGNFNKMDAKKRTDLKEIDGAQLAAIVEDRNGIYWYLGYNDYASATAVTGQTGASADDGNYFALTLTSYEGQLPYPVQASIVEELICSDCASEE